MPLSLFINCGPEAPIFNRTYFVENNSNVTVELVFYERFTNELKGTQLLSEGGSYRGESIEFHNLTQDFQKTII